VAGCSLGRSVGRPFHYTIPKFGYSISSHLVRTFATTTAGLIELGEWLQENGCTHVAMEATGVYWKPVWQVLADSRKCPRTIVHGDDEAEAKEKALAEHVARHPEDVGRTVEDFNWILHVIVRPAA
jgi:hypothetical protein